MSEGRNTAEYVALASGVVTAGGSALPWFRAGDVTAALLTGNDVFTLLFGLLVCWIYVVEDWHRRATLVVGAFGVLTLVVAGATILEVRDAIGNDPTIWLYLTTLGGFGLVIAGAMGYSEMGAGETEGASDGAGDRSG